MFPDTPDNAWSDTDDWQTNNVWLKAVVSLYGKADEVVVWTATRCNNASGGPLGGSGVALAWSALSGQPYKMVHELGHFFALPHPWENNTLVDPWTGLAHVKSDEWDLVYKPGTVFGVPHTYYDSKAEAQADEASLQRINTAGDASDNCSIDGGGIVTCTIRPCAEWYCLSEVKSAPDPALKGLGFTFGTMSGPNVMSYMTLGGTGPRALSNSQIALVRRYLRFDQSIDPTVLASWGKAGTVASGRRPHLGSWNVREPAAKLDFDNDGKRDLGYWLAPTAAGVKGTFKVLLSSQGYSQSPGQHVSADFGELGDVPVPGDYNGDGRTDFAVYQPGGGINRNDATSTQGYWRWCPTENPPTNTTTSSCTANGVVSAWGLREDVPLPGMAFQSGTPLLATFRPRTGQWAWIPAAGGSYVVRFLGGRGSVLLPGDYDTDFLTDIAVYNPTTAYFGLLRSQQSWNTQIWRSFGSKFIPAPSGTAQDRSGAIPTAGIFAPRLICNPTCLSYPRRAFSLWFPYDGTWNTLWDPLNGGSLHVCAWGIGNLDRPIENVDYNNDLWTDMAVHRAETYDSAAWVHIKNTTPAGGCGGSTTSRYFYGINEIRYRVFSVRDMTGDGRTEIVFLDPDTGLISWATSESGYASVVSRSVGNERMVFF
jgi:hypothetical protein